MSVFVVIPAYNEAATIGPVVRDIFSLYREARLVVVDDGSTDQTKKISQEAGAVVLSHVINRGQGAALKTGTDYALSQGAGIIVHFDADGQFEPKEIGSLIELIRRGEAEVVLGSRFLKKGASDVIATPDSIGGKQSHSSLATGLLRPPDLSVGGPRNDTPFSKKYFILPLARWVNFLFTGLWLSDAHNGFRAFSRRAAECIAITQDRMAHNSEIVAQIKKHRLTFKEMPVTVHYREYGQGVGGGVRIIKDLMLGKITNS